MPNYQNGKIYTIRSHKTALIYVGSTTQELSARMSGHRANFKYFNNGKYHYVTSFEILKFDDAYIELIENYPCENKAQLDKREGHFIREMDCCNKKVEGRSKEEYKAENKDKIKQKIAEYYQANKDELNKKTNKYRELNKDKIKQQRSEYREQNREIINEKKKQKRLEKKQQLENTN